MEKELSKEEILRKHFNVIWTYQQFDSWDKLAFAAMQEFATQEAKKEAIALQQEIERLKGLLEQLARGEIK